ncbi:hypothetical protein A9Z06_02260 [Rhizobium sp. YK2]|nr:hypothetical protein A9Z06_02260 [Rhizobium sp. YK2]
MIASICGSLADNREIGADREGFRADDLAAILRLDAIAVAHHAGQFLRLDMYMESGDFAP